jgi:methyl-accepting chemotaxis protein
MGAGSSPDRLAFFIQEIGTLRDGTCMVMDRTRLGRRSQQGQDQNVAIDFAAMRHLAPLAWKVAVAEGLLLLLGLAAAAHGGVLGPGPLHALAGGAAGVWILECGAAVAALRFNLQPVIEAVQAGDRAPAALAGRAASLATRLPTAGSRVLLGVGVAGWALFSGAAALLGWLPADVAVAALLLGTATSLLGALAAWAFCARSATELGERLAASAELSRAHRTLRAKVLLLGLSLNAAGTLLVGSVAYLHQRRDLLSGIDAAVRLRPFAWSLLVAMLAAFLACAALAWLAAGAITLPFRALDNAADRIASGDLTAAPASTSADEMGRLAAQFRRMAQGLTVLVREVQAASEKVSTGATEAGSIGEQVRRGALEQQDGVRTVQTAVDAMESSMALASQGLGGLSDYVSATSQTVGEMARAFDVVQKKAAELEQAMAGALGDVEGLGAAGRDAEGRLGALETLAARSSGTLEEVKGSVAGLERAATDSESTAAAVAEMADRAGLVVEGTLRGIEILRGAVADAHQRIAALGRRSDDIDQVVDFISEVAGRTNLLSLNASIIAAQAGEHGKAFAVVADQIRDLASQIARSTKSIGDIIHAVREDVEGTASLIDRGDALAAEGVQLARDSLGALAEIRRSTARGRDTAAGIRTAVQAHAQSSREVANLVELVADGSRAVAAAVQLVGRSVSSVHSISRAATGMADRVARTLEEQSGIGKRQLESLSGLESMIQEITKAVESHAVATQNVKKALQDLSRAAGQHESVVHGLSGISERIGSSARALSERVHRFKV